MGFHWCGLAGGDQAVHGSRTSPGLAHAFWQNPWPGQVPCEGGWGQDMYRGKYSFWVLVGCLRQWATSGFPQKRQN